LASYSELRISELEERLRDLREQLDDLERKAAQNERPRFAASVRYVSPDELAKLPVYSSR
jgi:hypothetical protein